MYFRFWSLNQQSTAFEIIIELSAIYWWWTVHNTKSITEVIPSSQTIYFSIHIHSFENMFLLFSTCTMTTNHIFAISFRSSFHVLQQSSMNTVVLQANDIIYILISVIGTCRWSKIIFYVLVNCIWWHVQSIYGARDLVCFYPFVFSVQERKHEMCADMRDVVVRHAAGTFRLSIIVKR